MREKSIIRYLKIFFFIFSIILIFAGIDFLFHTLSPEYSVPQRYFPNKILYGTIIGFIAYLFIHKIRSNYTKAVILSTIVAVLLQIRYFLEGYALDFVILFLIIHFFILFVLSYLSFSRIKQK